jgi:succinate dehydrogenase cytochrome b556 subunit
MSVTGAIFAQPSIKLILIGLLWALFHHLFAGIRFLLLDVHVGWLQLKWRVQAACSFSLRASCAQSSAESLLW